MKTVSIIALAGWLALAPSNPRAETFELEAIQDTWINGLNSSSNLGADDRLAICPVANYWIYFRFGLSGITGTVESAELRLTRFDGNRPEEISLYFIEDDDWSEASLTGTRRPSPANPANEDALAVGMEAEGFDRWASEALTAAVAMETAGDGVLTLMVREDPDTRLDVRRYFSREGGDSPATRPRLIVETAAGPMETVHAEWRLSDVAPGVKPAIDFGPGGEIHLMGMTEEMDGLVWHASAASPEGPWEPRTVAEGYFYGPGDIRVDAEGAAHLAWHDHDAQNPAHAIVHPFGAIETHTIDTPGSHDGWDNSLAFGPDGTLHMASAYPAAFGAENSLQYGSFDGVLWSFRESVEGSGPFMYGFNTSIAIGRDGNPHIAYCLARGWTGPGELRYAFRSGNGWTFSAVTSGENRGRFPSLALDHWDRPHIAWLDADEGNPEAGTVRYGVLNNEAWEIEDVDRLEPIRLGFSEARKSVSLALDSNYRPHIAYNGKRVLRYAVKPFGQWEYATVAESAVDLYQGMAVLALNSNQRPVIAFWQTPAGLPGLIRLAAPVPFETPVPEWQQH